MYICILSDSHDHRDRLASAVSSALKQSAEAVIHCGDVVAPSTLLHASMYGVPIHVIHGNNAGSLAAMTSIANRPNSNIHYYGQDAELVLAGKRIFVVHYPHYARAMALTGDWDIVCCGHSHKCSIEPITNIRGDVTYLVNPGSVGGVDGPATYIMANLESLEFTMHETS